MSCSRFFLFHLNYGFHFPADLPRVAFLQLRCTADEPTHTHTHTHTRAHTHTHTPDTRSKPVVRRSLFFGLLYLLGIFKVPQNAIRVDIRVIFSGYSLKPKRLTMNCIDSG